MAQGALFNPGLRGICLHTAAALLGAFLLLPLAGCDAADPAPDPAPEQAGFCDTLPERTATEVGRIDGSESGLSLRFGMGAAVASGEALIVTAAAFSPPEDAGSARGGDVPGGNAARGALLFARVEGSGASLTPVATLPGAPRAWGVMGDTLWWIDRELRLFEALVPGPGVTRSGDAPAQGVRSSRSLPPQAALDAGIPHLGRYGAWILDPSSPAAPGFVSWRDGESLRLVRDGTAPQGVPVDTLLLWEGPGNRLGGAPFAPWGRFPLHAHLPGGDGVMLAYWSDESPDVLLLRTHRADGTPPEELNLSLPRVLLSRARREEAVSVGLMLLDTAVARDARSPYPAIDPISEVNERALEARFLLPVHQPPFRELRVGADGSVWLRCDDAPDPAPFAEWHAPSHRWAALDAAGAPSFQVTLPRGSQLLAPSLDEAWGAVGSGSVSMPDAPAATPAPPRDVLVRWRFLPYGSTEG